MRVENGEHGLSGSVSGSGVRDGPEPAYGPRSEPDGNGSRRPQARRRSSAAGTSTLLTYGDERDVAPMSLPGIGSVSLSGFAHPWMLLTALVPVALIPLYLVAQRRRSDRLRRYAGDQPRADVVPSQPSRWRHLPVVVSVLALLLLTVALAAPTHEIKTPRNRTVIMLVIDVSRSMEADDVPPTRLAAAQKAAKDFANKLTPGVNLGLVAFSGNTNLLVSPTPDHQTTITALDHLTVDDGTATG